MTQRIALLGHPVAHSISPRFQQAALDALAIDARYEAWDVPPADLPIALERLRSAELLGANVTVPHKEAVFRLVDRLDPLAERVGAVNTIVRRDGQLHATNTDVAGILAALAGIPLHGASVLLLGAGGAARAVVVAMHQAGVSRLTIANRTLDRARALAVLAPGIEVIPCSLEATDATLREAMAGASLVMQSTTIGMLHGPDEAGSPVPADWFQPGQTAFDLVYNPERTPFLRAAEAAGARPLGGLAMLVHQGAKAFRLWTGVEPPLDVMFDAARTAMKEMASR
ncbi:MAG: shikimate dehydrogenase [Dehalococcoidia bacterium]